MLDELLRYDEQPLDDDFTLRVMRAVRRRQRLRRGILWGAGVVGAGFGVAGAAMLAEPVAAVFESAALPVAVGLVLLTAGFAWLLQDETLSTG